LIQELDVRTLIQIGLTSNQAKLYIALLKVGRLNASNVSKHSKVPRQEVYRVLNELQRMGLVEKTVAVPCEFEAISVNDGLQILISRKFEQVKELQKKTKEILRENQFCRLEKMKKQEHRIIMIRGKQRLMQIFRHQHDNVQQKVDVLSTLQRWLQILDFCFQDYLEALDRGVKYRVVIAKPAGEITFPENIKSLLAKPGFELRLSEEPLKINAAVFDENEATLNFLEGKSLTESPVIWTNHPGFIQMCRDHFDKVWKSSKEYKIQNENNL
jgi:sugar-specific transcriptional regulator TrmB